MSLKNRVERLEARTGQCQDQERPTILIVGVDPSGLRDISQAVILSKGITVYKDPGESNPDFLQRVANLGS